MLRCPPGSTRLTIVPVAGPGTTRRAGVTPSAASSATRAVPAASSPTHPAKVTGVPSRARWTATFAPAPPPRLRIDAGRSEPGAGSPASATTTSVATSPTTTTGRISLVVIAVRRWSPREARGQRDRDLPGQLGVAQHQADVDRQRRAGAGPVQVVEDERGQRLAPDPG